MIIFRSQKNTKCDDSSILTTSARRDPRLSRSRSRPVTQYFWEVHDRDRDLYFWEVRDRDQYFWEVRDRDRDLYFWEFRDHDRAC
jgi:hypothetical protein